MVQELADGDAFGEGCSVPVEVDQPLVDELKHERRDEDLGHAPDAESVIGRERLARSQVGEAGRCLDPPVGPNSYRDGALDTGREHGLQLVIHRFHCRLRSDAAVCDRQTREYHLMSMTATS